MPNEIADSDGEFDFDPPTPAQRQSSSKHTLGVEDHHGDNDLGVNFDDFLNSSRHPSQGTSPLRRDRAVSDEKSDGSTDTPLTTFDRASAASGKSKHDANDDMWKTKHNFEFMSPAGPKSIKNKRRHTGLTDGVDLVDKVMANERRSRKKRPKTYGSSSRRLRSSQSSYSSELFDGSSQQHDIEGPESMQLEEESDEANGAAQSADMAPPTIEPAPKESSYEYGIPRQRNRPRRVMSLLNDSMPSACREVSTARSSVGDYESINIDFRNTGNILDVGRNPFGNLSQDSTDERDHELDANNIANIFSRPADTSITLPLSDTTMDSLAQEGTFPSTTFDTLPQLSPFQTPGRPKTLDPSMLLNGLPNDTQPLSSSKASSCKRRKTDKDSLRDVMSPTVYDDSFSPQPEEQPAKPQAPSKKRGRKPKNSPVPPTSPGPVVSEDHDLNSDELTIGLPKEQYKPRPTRSRGGSGQIPADDLPATSPGDGIVRKCKQREGSPIKQPIGDLQLSDEAFVGMPKENYKPRPSRSRSKKAVEDEEDAPNGLNEDITEQFDPSSMAPNDEDAPLPTKKPKKESKKSKVKRAKTSAAALLKKSDKMLSDGEEDVVWLDSKPAKVKLDLPPDIIINGRTVKDEGDEGKEHALENKEAGAEVFDGTKEDVEYNDRTEDSGPGGRGSEDQNVVVDAASPRRAPAQPEPKKRGRKRKKTAEIPPADEGAAAAAATDDVGASVIDEKKVAPLESAITRPVLLERDANIPTDASASTKHIISSKQTTATTPSPQKNRKAASPEQENRPLPAEKSDETPPQKQDAGEKGPAKHSPIVPRGGKSNYRVGLSRRAFIPPLLKIVRK